MVNVWHLIHCYTLSESKADHIKNEHFIHTNKWNPATTIFFFTIKFCWQIILSKYLSTHNWPGLAFPEHKGKEEGVNSDVLATEPQNPPLTRHYTLIYLHHSSDHLTSHRQDTIYLLYSTSFFSPATVFLLSFESQYHFCRPLNRVICEFKVCHFLTLSAV